MDNIYYIQLSNDSVWEKDQVLRFHTSGHHVPKNNAVINSFRLSLIRD